MNTGMLWYDDDPKIDLLAKISRATEYYQKKYGQKPNLCYVNPGVNLSAPDKSFGVDVQTNQMILPNHFWLGIKTATLR